jgi:putative sigma-54 modulation protein
MKHVNTAKNTTVTEAISNYVEKRFAKFDKYASSDTKAHTKIEVKDNGKRHKVEVTIYFGKQTLRAEANDVDMYAAIDIVEKTMIRLLKKRKEKLESRHRCPQIALEDDQLTDLTYNIVRSKSHQLVAMTDQEACEAMEMVGHSFYAYFDTDENKMCVVYMRDDGDCGKLIYDN